MLAGRDVLLVVRLEKVEAATETEHRFRLCLRVVHELRLLSLPHGPLQWQSMIFRSGLTGQSLDG